MKKATAFLVTLITLASCATTKLPDNYVADKEVVFLQQKTSLEPIIYPPLVESPYKWNFPAVTAGSDKSTIKNIKDIIKLSEIDPNYDAKIFNEVKQHLLFMKSYESIANDISLLNSHTYEKPAPLRIGKGRHLKNYTNAVEYEYPYDKNATIVDFNDGAYQINFSDGRIYTHKKDSSYYGMHKDGKELFAVFEDDNQLRVLDGDRTFGLIDDTPHVKTKTYRIFKTRKPTPQYGIEFLDSNEKYYYFFDENEDTYAVKYVNRYGIEFYYTLPKADKDGYVDIVSKDNLRILLRKDHIKSISKIDPKKNETKEILSIYFKEGIKLLDFDSSITYSELRNRWPENYQKINVGNFSILYTKKDQDLLKKLDSSKLDEIETFVKSKTKLSFKEHRTIIIPPELNSYIKHYVANDNQKVQWYPSGFETKDYVVMWPISVPRYKQTEGDEYFWNKEFYTILLHELVHLAVGENTGIISNIPVWLNEGLAVYVESLWDKDSKQYWDTTFNGSLIKEKLLSWNDITMNGTGFFPIADARVHYAQSYSMVKYLIDTYGIDKTISYLRSFKVNVNSEVKRDLLTDYKANFKSKFKISWEENLMNFTKFSKNNI